MNYSANDPDDLVRNKLDLNHVTNMSKLICSFCLGFFFKFKLEIDVSIGFYEKKNSDKQNNDYNI